MKRLQDYLGDWLYTDQLGNEKWYRIRPTVESDLYTIRWGSTREALDTIDSACLKVPAAVALAKILSKVRGGFKLEYQYTGEIRASSHLSTDNLHNKREYAIKAMRQQKRLAKEKEFNFIDWIGGKDFPESEN